MNFDVASLINDIIVILGVAGSIFGLNKKFPLLQKAETYIAGHAKAIETVIEEIVHVPVVEQVIDKVSDELINSTIAKYALIGLHSFSAKISTISDTQKIALLKFVIESCPVEWNINETKVLEVINRVEAEAIAFENLEIVKAANYFTSTQKIAI